MARPRGTPITREDLAALNDLAVRQGYKSLDDLSEIYVDGAILLPAGTLEGWRKRKVAAHRKLDSVFRFLELDEPDIKRVVSDPAVYAEWCSRVRRKPGRTDNLFNVLVNEASMSLRRLDVTSSTLYRRAVDNLNRNATIQSFIPHSSVIIPDSDLSAPLSNRMGQIVERDIAKELEALSPLRIWASVNLIGTILILWLIPLAPALPTCGGLKPFLHRHRQDVDRAGSTGISLLIFMRCKRQLGLDLTIVDTFPHTLEIVDRLLVGDYEDAPDLCAIAVGPATRLIGKTTGYEALTLLPPVEVALVVPPKWTLRRADPRNEITIAVPGDSVSGPFVLATELSTSKSLGAPLKIQHVDPHEIPMVNKEDHGQVGILWAPQSSLYRAEGKVAFWDSRQKNAELMEGLACTGVLLFGVSEYFGTDVGSITVFA